MKTTPIQFQVHDSPEARLEKLKRLAQAVAAFTGSAGGTGGSGGVGTVFTDTEDGLVPAPAGDTGFLRNDGVWTDPATGSVWRVGSGAPADTLGTNGDFYLDEATSDVYQKASDAYSLVANIRGAQGPAGATGATGAAGSNGTNGTDGADGVVQTVSGTTDEIDVDSSDPANLVLSLAAAVLASLALADSAVQSVVAGTNVTVDNTDPQNPVVSASGGGATDFWDNVVTQPFDVNTTGFSSNGSGSWAISGGELVQSTTTTNGAVFRYTTPVPYAALRIKVDLYFTSAGAGSTQAVGFFLGPASPAAVPTNSAAIWLRNDSGTKTFSIELFGGSSITSAAQTFTLDAYHTFEVIMMGARLVAYLDGVVIGSILTTNTTFHSYDSFGLFTYGGLAKFKDFSIDVAAQ